MDKLFLSDIDVGQSTPPPLYIPTEVCENIIDMLYSLIPQETLANIATLHSCALVCRDWRVRSQSRLFNFVQLSDITSLRRLSAILDNGPHLRYYVYQVELTGCHLHNTTSIFALFPVLFAGKLPNLVEIDVVHLGETEETGFSKKAVSPKAKSTPYIPLHSCFAAVLRSFTTISELYLISTTFRSFGELFRIIRALTNLQALTCRSVCWITTGGLHPGADFMQHPNWATGPNIRELKLTDIPLYGAERLILAYRPHLTELALSIPLSDGPEEPSGGGGIDLGSCTALDILTIDFTPQFSVDTHGKLVKDLLISWKPRCLKPLLVLESTCVTRFTRRGLAGVLRGLGATTEAWLQTIEESHLVGESVNDTCGKHELYVRLYGRETEKGWWADHLRSCFPTWLRLGWLSWSFKTPQSPHQEWAYEESLKSDPSIPSVEEIDSHS